MTIATMLSLGETALKLGLICSLTVLALFLSYSMLNVCDLSTDGCFTFGAAVGAVVAVSGHPFLSIIAAMAAGIISGFVYCGYGRIISDQYEPDDHRVYHDERYTCRHSTERKRRYHYCSNRSDPCNCISGIFPENKTWSCNQGNWK